MVSAEVGIEDAKSFVEKVSGLVRPPLILAPLQFETPLPPISCIAVIAFVGITLLLLLLLSFESVFLTKEFSFVYGAEDTEEVVVVIVAVDLETTLLPLVLLLLLLLLLLFVSLLRMDMCCRNGSEVSIVKSAGAFVAETGLKDSFVWMVAGALFFFGGMVGWVRCRLLLRGRKEGKVRCVK